MIYVIRRFGFLLLTLFLTSIIVFAITQWLPGDVARIVLGREVGGQAEGSEEYRGGCQKQRW